MIKKFYLAGIFILALVGMIPVVSAQACDEFANAHDYTNRVIERFEAEDYRAALDDANCALELASADDADNAIYFANRGIIYTQLTDYDEALADFDSAEAFNPDYEPLHYSRGVIYYLRGDYVTALENYQIALELSPDEANTHLAIAWVHVMQEDGLEHEEFAAWIQAIRTETISDTLTGSIQDEIVTLAEGKVYSYAFDGTAGQVISISAKSDRNAEADPLLVLVDSAGKALISDDDSGVNLDAVIANYALPADDTYTIVLSHSGGETDGDISLTIDLGEEDSGITESFLTYKLFVGEKAEVYTTEGDRLNLRSGPGLDYEILGKLEKGTVVTLVEGPRKAEGYAWWFIRTDDGQEGWSVERVEEEQTLQLALLVGEQAIVTSGGDKLNVRTAAGTGNDLAFQIDDGATVTLLDIPQVVDGFRWWKISTDDAQEGWIIDRFEGERMLIPAKEGN